MTSVAVLGGTAGMAVGGTAVTGSVGADEAGVDGIGAAGKLGRIATTTTMAKITMVAIMPKTILF
ncbi:MAG: hypothetical protein R3E79_24280 [Caldilineaceae bacterium]